MPWVPSIGSGFDALAGQQQYYTGLNTDVLRGNVNAVADANQQRNQYLFSLAQMQQQQAEKQADADAKAQENQMAAYQFNANLAEQQREADQAAAIKNRQLTLGAADDTETETTRKAEAADAENLNAATDMATKGKFASRQDLQAAIPNATKSQIDDLWDTNTTASAGTTRQFQFSNTLAQQLNLRQVYGDQIAQGPPKGEAPTPVSWWNPVQAPMSAGWALGGTGYFGKDPDKVDTSWFDALKTKADAIDRNLGKLNITFDDKSGQVLTPSNTSLQDYGVFLNPKTGRYEPLNPDISNAATPAAPGPTRWIPTAPVSPDITAATPTPPDVAVTGATVTPPPAASAKIATPLIIRNALMRANGNRQSARALLLQQGYTIPPAQ